MPSQPLLVPCSFFVPYLLHSWNTVEEENGEDASGSSESTSEATAKESVSGLVVGRFGIARMSVLSDQALRVNSVDVEWNLVSVGNDCERTAFLNRLASTYCGPYLLLNVS